MRQSRGRVADPHGSHTLVLARSPDLQDSQILLARIHLAEVALLGRADDAHHLAFGNSSVPTVGVQHVEPVRDCYNVRLGRST